MLSNAGLSLSKWEFKNLEKSMQNAENHYNSRMILVLVKKDFFFGLAARPIVEKYLSEYYKSQFLKLMR